MLSKEEIKKGLTEELGRTITANECGLSTNDFKKDIEILEDTIKYIEQLESDKQKLIEKLEAISYDLEYDRRLSSYSYLKDVNEILSILKGEKYG